mgnify:CR=1 FL=1
MKGSQLVPTRMQIKQAVRYRLESEEFKKQLSEITKETFKEYSLFFISSAMLTLADKFSFDKDKLLQFQTEVANCCKSYVKEHDEGNKVTTSEILDTLDKDYNIKYNKEEDIFE